jgi:type I restriction enzyme R subunit
LEVSWPCTLVLGNRTRQSCWSATHIASKPSDQNSLGCQHFGKYESDLLTPAKRVDAGHADETPKTLDTPGKRALYNNLSRNEGLALKIDETAKRTRPDGWRGIQAREQVIKAGLYGVLQDVAEVERIFLIVKAQTEY